MLAYHHTGITQTPQCHACHPHHNITMKHLKHDPSVIIILFDTIVRIVKTNIKQDGDLQSQAQRYGANNEQIYCQKMTDGLSISVTILTEVSLNFPLCL